MKKNHTILLLLGCICLSAKSQKQPAYIFFESNLLCSVYINGEDRGLLNAHEAVRFEIPIGKNSCVWKSLAGDRDSITEVIPMEAGQQRYWQINFPQGNSFDQIEEKISLPNNTDERYSFLWGEEDSIRNPLYAPYPVYNTSDEGVITLVFTISPDGTINKVVTEPTSQLVLRKNAMTAVSQWKFSPLPADAPQEDQIVKMDITFILKD